MSRLFSSRFVESSPRYRDALRSRQEKVQAVLREKEEETQVRAREERRRQAALCNASLTRLMTVYASERPTAAAIIEVVARRHNLTADDLRGEDRQRHVVEARFDAIAEVYMRIPAMGLTAIGQEFGGRDQRTIGNAVAARNVPRRKVRLSSYRADILRLHHKGKSVKDIAFLLGCSASTITNILRRERLDQGQHGRAAPVIR